MKSTVEIAKTLLHSRKLKVTPTRLEVLQTLQKYNSAVTFTVIQKACKKTDRVTLYRTIQSFLDKGIIHKAFQSEDETYFALCSHNCSSEAHFHNHIHFKCTNCNKVTCEHLSEEMKIVLPQFEIHKVDINISGICIRCK